jgi:hypothetical protein
MNLNNKNIVIKQLKFQVLRIHGLFRTKNPISSIEFFFLDNGKLKAYN